MQQAAANTSPTPKSVILLIVGLNPKTERSFLSMNQSRSEEIISSTMIPIILPGLFVKVTLSRMDLMNRYLNRESDS